MMEPVLDVPDERSPQVMAYWAKRGMVKEFHGYDEPTDWDDYEAKTGYRWKAEEHRVIQNEHRIWTSFVPVSAFAPANRQKKYPVVFALHGACNNIFLVEGWGFVQEAARREWIVIIPSLELDEFVLDILEQAKNCILWIRNVSMPQVSLMADGPPTVWETSIRKFCGRSSLWYGHGQRVYRGI